MNDTWPLTLLDESRYRLSTLPLAAQGLYVRCVQLVADGPNPTPLERDISAYAIAKAVGSQVRTVKKLLLDLEEADLLEHDGITLNLMPIIPTIRACEHMDRTAA